MEPPTTAILSALAEEQAGLLELLHRPERVNRAGRDFWRGELQGQRVVLALSRIGKVAAATTATTLIEAFGVTFCFDSEGNIGLPEQGCGPI